MNLYLVIGIQGAGKSTYALNLKDSFQSQNQETVIYEKDDYNCTYEKFIKIVKDKIQTNKQIKNFIVVATFLETEKRQLLLENLKEISFQNKTCYYHQLNDESFADCQINVLRRQYQKYSQFFMTKDDINVKDNQIFPISALFVARKKYVNPKESEGWDKLINYSVHKPVFDTQIYKNKALILDYDGTLRISKGEKVYPIKKEDISILSNRTQKLKQYENKDYLLLGISNQSAVAKKEISYQDCELLFEETNRLLEVDIKYLFCPHKSFPVSCYCRKPQVGNLVKLIEEYKLNPKDCIFIGDMKTDQTVAKKLFIDFYFANQFFN